MKKIIKFLFMALVLQGFLSGCSSPKVILLPPDGSEPMTVNYRVRLQRGITQVQWQAEEGKTYSVFYQDGPEQQWLPLCQKVRGTGQVESVDDQVPVKTRRMYRVVEVK